MPTYEYQCGACEHKWEEFQSISAKPTKKCPECGRAKAERLISAGGGIIFRGSGFYQTDYRSDSYRKGAEAAKKASDGGSSGGGSGGSGGGGFQQIAEQLRRARELDLGRRRDVSRGRGRLRRGVRGGVRRRAGEPGPSAGART